MQIVNTEIAGCYEILFNTLKDTRGGFIKTYHEEVFRQKNISFNIAEEYFTYSFKNVFRGLHFQIPPMALEKIVFCVLGNVIDYVVDIRKGSPTFGKFISFNLDGEEPKAIYIPIGLAHGFYVKSDKALMQYKTSTVYNSKYDAGILYKSFDFAREIPNPIISARDLNFQSLDQFNTPFVY